MTRHIPTVLVILKRLTLELDQTREELQIMNDLVWYVTRGGSETAEGGK